MTQAVFRTNPKTYELFLANEMGLLSGFVLSKKKQWGEKSSYGMRYGPPQREDSLCAQC
jgi:hypothetical protein